MIRKTVAMGALFMVAFSQFVSADEVASIPPAEAPSPIQFVAYVEQHVERDDPNHADPGEVRWWSSVNWAAWQFLASLIGFALVYLQVRGVSKTIATMQSSDRAWMLTNRPEVTYFRDKTELNLAWQNYGKSPAFITSYGLRLFTVKPETRLGGNFFVVPIKTDSDAIIMAAEDFTRKTNFDGGIVDDAMQTAIREGSLFLIIRATISYTDAFNAKHETSICLKNDPTIGPSHFICFGGRKYNYQT